MRRNRSAVAGVLIAAGLLATSAARAAVIDMSFDTLQNDEFVNSYYDGGTGSLGSGPGPNYGVTFANAIVLNDAANNENLLVSEPNTIAFLSGTGSIMDVPAGFTTGFSFDYSA
jgi:hypothetical protein